MKDDGRARRSMLSGIGAAVAAFVLGSGKARAQAPAQVPGGGFRPARHPQDEWLDAVPGSHRTFIDTSSSEGAGAALLYANNLYTANQAGYSLADRDVAVVICFRHISTIFAFNDAMWAKYGKLFAERTDLVDPKTKQPPTVNLMNAAGYGPALANGGVTIDAVVKRGAHFAVCSMATRRLAGQVATATGVNVDEAVKELMANAIPNSHFVPAGVVAVNRAQERGYTLLSA